MGDRNHIVASFCRVSWEEDLKLRVSMTNLRSRHMWNMMYLS